MISNLVFQMEVLPFGLFATEYLWERAEGHFMPVEFKVVSLARCLLKAFPGLKSAQL